MAPSPAPNEQLPPLGLRDHLLCSLSLLPVLISALLAAAHFLRRGTLGMAIACLVPLLLLFSRKRWVTVVWRVLLGLSALVWLHTATDLVRLRLAYGAPYLRLLLILSSVAAFSLLSGWVFSIPALRRRFAAGTSTVNASVAAFLLTGLLLVVVQWKVSRPMLLPDRFAPGAGWILIVIAASYAAWITEKLLVDNIGRWRLRIWTLFSIVFFGQLALGLLVDIRFMMRPDAIHLPIPAMIAAGPIYRGGQLFMLVLFASTLLFVGPAWCSHICYLGSWDLHAALRLKRANPLPAWSTPLRVLLLVVLLGIAWLLNLLGVRPLIAAGIALGFLALGLLLMLIWSRRVGTMAHCLVYCPIGLIANVLGKISPFRLRIGDGCTSCGACTIVCRYDALRPEHLDRRKVGLTCTLCGDCLPSCRTNHLSYGFFSLAPAKARTLFVVLVVALHATSLCLARV